MVIISPISDWGMLMNFSLHIFGLGFHSILLGIVLFSSAAGVICADDDEPSGPAIAPADTQAVVKLAAIREGVLPTTLRALGKINASRQMPASIMSLAPGAVTKIMVHDGRVGQLGNDFAVLRSSCFPFRVAKSPLIAGPGSEGVALHGKKTG